MLVTIDIAKENLDQVTRIFDAMGIDYTFPPSNKEEPKYPDITGVYEEDEEGVWRLRSLCLPFYFENYPEAWEALSESETLMAIPYDREDEIANVVIKD